MATLDIAFVGMCAIVLDSELDCTKKVEPKDYRASKFDVLLLRDAHHQPRLYLDAGGIRLPCDAAHVAECLDGCVDGDRTEVDASECLDWRKIRTERLERWAVLKLDDTRVTLHQGVLQRPEMRRGHRRLGMRGCWDGPRIYEGCYENDLGCSSDVSWIAEVDKAAQSGKVKPLTELAAAATATLERINGDLYSQWVHDRTWHWTGQDQDGMACDLTPISYEQSFARRALIKNAKASSIELAGPQPRKIRLSGRVRGIVSNLPEPDHAVMNPETYVDSDGNQREGCVAHHYAMYYSVLTEPPACRPIPATDPVRRLSDGVKICVDEAYGGFDDPFCAPTLVDRGKGP